MRKLYDAFCFSINPFNFILGFVSGILRDVVCHKFWVEAKCVCEDVTVEHVAGDEDRTCCRKLVKALICTEYLRQWVVLARRAPRLLDCSDMLRFGDRRANAIRRAKEPYPRDVMLQGMLPWEGKAIRAHAGGLKCHAIRMEPIQSLLHGC